VNSAPKTDLAATLGSIHTEAGSTLLSLTEASPVLLIFLRHFGCSFCRQAISDVADVHAELSARNVRPVFVHLGTPERAKTYFDYYGLHDVDRISDPGAIIYHHPAFALGRIHPALHLINPRVWAGWLKGSIYKHGIGNLKDDAHQMPGLFFLKGPSIARRFRYKSIADRPNYLKFVS
jgi:peroxiredoxin